jgi:AraC family transcriptional regulator, transcriptional activator of pobA
MSGSRFPARGFVTETMEHMILVHPHWHSEVEVLYYINGPALQQVNDNIFTAGPGDIIVIGKDQPHSTYSTGKGNNRILVLQFDAERMLAHAPGGMHTQFANRTIYGNPIKGDSVEGRPLLQCIEEIYGELQKRKESYEYIVCSALYRFAGLLARSGLYTVSRGRDESIGSIHTMLENTFRLVDESYADEITLEDAARASHLSTTHFCRMFRKTTGMTFHDYLTFFRVNRAEKMLYSSKKLAEIAFDCGFGSVSAFIRNFKAYKDYTPSSFIREMEKQY